MKCKLSTKNVSIHYSFIILIICSFVVNLFNLLFFYFLFLVLHELVHSFVARKLGYKIGKINLLATGAILDAESDEFSFNDEILISISAPLFNLLLAIIFLGFWWVVPESYNFTQDLMVINLAIFSFNMLPIFPLDGGRVLLAFLSKTTSRKKAVIMAKIVAIVLTLFLFILFIVSLFVSPNFSLGMISVTLFISAISEDKSAGYKRLLFLERKKKRIKNKGVETRFVMVQKGYSESFLLRQINARFFTIFIVVDENLNIIKQIKENEIY